MGSEVYRFGEFTLDASNRRLSEGGASIALNSRYLDALAVLVRQRGQLVSKQSLVDEAWKGVPVSDEALTQAVRVLRRQLGDSASQPRYIETVAKHGYRFVAPVHEIDDDQAIFVQQPNASMHALWDRIGAVCRTGTLAAAAAGALGGLIYGLAEASGPVSTGSAGISIVLIYVFMSATIALLGGAGVSFGVAVAMFAPQLRHPAWAILGGALGGMSIGAIVKLIGVDAFHLLFGASPRDITGAFEGLLLGSAIGLGVFLSGSSWIRTSRDSALLGGVLAGVAGAIIPVFGGRMMGGSLELLAQSFPNSQLHLRHVSLFFGGNGFQPFAYAVTGALEGFLFGGSVVAAISITARNLSKGA